MKSFSPVTSIPIVSFNILRKNIFNEIFIKININT